MNQLGERLRLLRTESGMTQQAFADLFDIGNKARISSYEKGINAPDDDTKIRIAEYFGVSLDWLLGRTNDRSATKIKSSPNKVSPGERVLKILEEEGIIVPGGDIPDDIANEILDGLRAMAKLAKKKI